MENEMNAARENIHKGLDIILNRAEVLGEEGMTALYTAKQRAAAVRDDIGYYIYRKPETAILVAAGIGVLAGLLIGAVQANRKHFFSIRLQ